MTKQSLTERLNRIFSLFVQNPTRMYAENQKYEVFRKQVHKLSLAKGLRQKGKESNRGTVPDTGAAVFCG